MAVRIAVVTESDKGLDDVVAQRAGRAPYITIVEVDEEGKPVSVTVRRNPGSMSGGGAGVRMAQAVAESGAKIIVGPAFGPNAAAILAELGVKTVTMPPGTPVREAVRKALETLG